MSLDNINTDIDSDSDLQVQATGLNAGRSDVSEMEAKLKEMGYGDLHKDIIFNKEGGISTIRFKVKDLNGKVISQLYVSLGSTGYNIYDRKTDFDHRGRGLAGLLLKQAESLIRQNLNGEASTIYLDTTQSSVIGFMEKNGYTFKDGKPDLSKEEIIYEQDGDIFYDGRYRLEKKI